MDLAIEMRQKHRALLDEFLQQAGKQLQGTLYSSMSNHRVLEARYGNVLEVIAEYAELKDEAFLIQHLLIIFIQRFYVDIDESNPLTSSLILQRVNEITKSSRMGTEICLAVLTPQHQAKMGQIYSRMCEIIIQIGEYLNRRLNKFATRIPTIRLQDIDYGTGALFDIDPTKWPYRG